MTLVIDYGAGNMRSVLNALDELGETPTVSDDPATVAKADRIILPGVGAMKPAMARLRARGLDRALTDAVRGRDVPILGICLGMQMMCSVGHEGGEPVQGLGWIDGEVVLLEGAPPQRRVPHFGWSEAQWTPGCPLASKLRASSAFYFCHSYHAVTKNPDDVAATVEFGGPHTAALWNGSAIAVQFHPERSGKSGLQLLENFLDWDGVSRIAA
jgi:imidazole glycerol-phosphate synthase subunit HisH